MSQPPDKLDIQMVFDDRQESYKNFFDYTWVRGFLDAADRSGLKEPALFLARDWKSTGVGSAVGWLMMESLQSYHVGITTGNPAFFELFTKAFPSYLEKRTAIGDTQRKQIVAVVEQLRQDTEKMLEQNPTPFERDEMWKQMISVSDFAMALWSIQRMCYTSVYGSYENFVQRTVAVGKRDESYRAKKVPILIDAFTELFGKELAERCLTCAEMKSATLVRNCLTHDGGRVSKELAAVAHGVRVEGGQLQLMPEHVRALFDRLKDNASKIAEAAISLPAFQPGAS